MKVLVTSSRMPFALDAIRKLGSAGHEVWACDTYSVSPGGHSKYLEGRATTSSPSGDTRRFVDDVERLVREHDIEFVLPAFEEAFYLATQHERLSSVTRLFTAPFATLARLHDKSTFQQLATKLGLPVPETVLARSDEELREATERWPRWFARAAFSRGGVSLLTNTGPLAEHTTIDHVHPTEESPWLVQPFVDGPMIPTYSLVHEGRVAAHCTYRAPRQWEHSTAIQFESIDGSETLPITQAIAEETGYTGQISFDFVDSEDGLVLIECNPRMTDGELLFSADELEAGLFHPPGPGEDPIMAAPGQLVQLDFAVLGQIFREPLRELPRSFDDLLHVRDPASGWHDHLPSLYSFLALAHHERLALRERTQLFVAMADGMTWDGQAIDGMSDADKRVLTELEGSAPEASGAS